MVAPVPREGLKKELTLFDVYAISTGAMFSSGFFLLPGLAAAQAGPAVVLAYLLASFFILPAMFSVAELSTAMPRAGGAYYFLDRALGPIVGTVGGLGTWLALVLKSASSTRAAESSAGAPSCIPSLASARVGSRGSTGSSAVS